MPGDIDHFPGRGIGALVAARGDRLADCSGKAEEQQPSDHCNEDPHNLPRIITPSRRRLGRSGVGQRLVPR
jgi:hypothetical protein